jgi:hypothetical protein
MRYYTQYSAFHTCAVTCLTPKEIYLLCTLTPEEYAQQEPFIQETYDYATKSVRECCVSKGLFQAMQDSLWDVFESGWSDRLHRGYTVKDLALVCYHYRKSQGRLPEYIELVPHVEPEWATLTIKDLIF